MPEVKYAESPGHFEEWVRAIQGGPPAMSNFPDYSAGLTETMLLGNLAVWVADKGKGEKVEWDAKNLRSTNVAGLEPIIKPTYRAGYTLDGRAARELRPAAATPAGQVSRWIPRHA